MIGTWSAGLSVAATLLIACRPSSTAVPPSTEAPSTAAPSSNTAHAAAKAAKASAAEPRAIIPARYVGVGWFARKGAPLFGIADRLPGGTPACVHQLLSTIDGYYQADALDKAPSLIAVRGKIDRAAAEACLQVVMSAFGPGARVERDGAITRLAAGAGASYLGWASDGTVYSNTDRGVVEEALAQKTTIASNAPVMALVARVDRSRSAWLVMAADVTSKLIGVPSTGVLFASDLLGTKHTTGPLPRLPIAIEFASPADATRAVAAIRAPHPALSRALQDLLGKLSPLAHDRDVEIDITPIFAHADASLLEEMTGAITRLGASR